MIERASTGSEASPSGASGPPDMLSIAVFSGDYARVHYALVMACGALTIDRRVTLFFTMEASHAVMDGPDGPGWHRLTTASGVATAEDADRALIGRGIGGFEELLTACRDLGARFVLCEMGLRALGLDGEPRRADLPIEIAGVVTFLTDASRDGAVVFI